MAIPSFTAKPDQEYKVTPLELFFDLVFVFAVSQLSHHLLTHLSWRGVAETLVLLLIQLGRTVWTIVSAPNPLYQDHYFRVLIWLIVTSPLWIAGAAVDSEARLAWWALAAGIDQIGTWLAQPIPGRRLRSEHVWFPSGHMVERCRLFLLIALGETILTTGTAIAAAPTTLMSVVTGTAALVGTVALWALAFGHVGRLLLEFVEETRDPIRASRHAVNALVVRVKVSITEEVV